MIESLTVTNFYCFKERTTILFTAKKERNRMLDNNFCGFTTQNKINILKLVFLLGNNGAGKSKILSAFDALQYLIAQIRERKDESLRYRPFAFDEECLNKPSEIEIVYHINDSRYLYSIKWDKYAIYEEILDELRTKTNINLFHRWYDKVSDIVKVDFTDKIQVSDNENDKTENSKQLKNVICSFLKSVDTNIMSYEKLKIDVEYPAELLQKLKSLSDKQEAELRMLFRMDEEKHIVNTFHRLDKKTGNRRGRLPLSEQSDGTKEILRFLIVLDEAIRKEKTIILDDYSSGVQRNTLNQLLKFFLGAAQNAQLIISTQDYSLLDFDIIRRDSIRFLVKDDIASAHVQSINLSLLHKNSSLHHYVSKMNVYEQLPKMDEALFEELLRMYKTIAMR